MAPPEFHPPKWRKSIERLQNEKISRIAPTHFGFFDDVEWQLDTLIKELDSVENWMLKTVPLGLQMSELREEFIMWSSNRAKKLGVTERSLDVFEIANPSSISADGIKRYWEKYINSESTS
jgi:hypothetical protein